MLRPVPAIVLGILLTNPCVVAAQSAEGGFYFGGGLSADSLSDSTGATGSGASGFVSAGVSGPLGGAGFWAGELDATIGEIDGTGFQTTRLRGLAGRHIDGVLGGVDAYLSFGLARQSGDLPAGLAGGTVEGMTFGLGVQVPVGEDVKLRFEALRDQFEGAGAVTDWSNTSLRAGAVFSF